MNKFLFALLLLLLLLLTACSDSSSVTTEPDAGAADVAPEKQIELACPPSACGVFDDKRTGGQIDCGACAGYQTCGDNGFPNSCGSSCLPIKDGRPGYPPFDVAGCDYELGPGWGQGYGTELQYSAACLYPDRNNCFPITVPQVAGEPCSGDVCGDWWCCVEDLDAGVSSLLPGAHGDGG